ncbi:MAG: fumarylacetoacetate hydrolase, partial [Thermomicrobiales bacterium]|nr:fumarylacetoacetate hydrolase [Thermomicrobiales bacterium]
MRIAAFDDARIGVIANDDTVVDATDLLQPYEPLGPEDLLPDLIAHFDDLRPELERRAAAGNGTPLAEARLRSPLTRP